MRLDEALAFGDVKGLSKGVGVPCGAGAGGEPHGADADARRFFAAGDGVDVDVSGEPLGWTLGGWLLGLPPLV